MKTEEEYNNLALELWRLVDHRRFEEATQLLRDLDGTKPLHPVFDRTWWMNNYKEGSVAIVFSSGERATQRCGEGGEQVEVRIVPVKL